LVYEVFVAKTHDYRISGIWPREFGVHLGQRDPCGTLQRDVSLHW
jgi:hypothetical protein